MRLNRTVPLVVAVGALAMTTLAGPAQAAATTTLAQWEMNEPPGATVMSDSSGNGITGSIGAAVATGVVYHSETGYKWTSTQPNQPPTKPERLIQVNDSRLNPGTRDYAVTIRFRTTNSYGNIIQKGQNGAVGGYFKFEIPLGIVTCLFKGVSGQRAIKSKTALNDGEWHTVRCERTSAGLAMTVDAGPTQRLNGSIGSISNTVPLTIGGKVNCDQIKITCDYFPGGLDRVLIETG